MTASVHSCNVCNLPITKGEGEECVACGAWFHFDTARAEGRRCGVYSDAVPGLGA